MRHDSPPSSPGRPAPRPLPGDPPGGTLRWRRWAPALSFLVALGALLALPLPARAAPPGPVLGVGLGFDTFTYTLPVFVLYQQMGPGPPALRVEAGPASRQVWRWSSRGDCRCPPPPGRRGQACA